jgi:hypothetical protein
LSSTCANFFSGMGPSPRSRGRRNLRRQCRRFIRRHLVGAALARFIRAVDRYAHKPGVKQVALEAVRF